MPVYNFRQLMKLDLAVNNHFHDGKGPLSNELRALPVDTVMIPEFFDFLDVRMPANEYIDKKLDLIINEIFNHRQSLEKNFSRGELLAYDRQLAQ